MRSVIVEKDNAYNLLVTQLTDILPTSRCFCKQIFFIQNSNLQGTVYIEAISLQMQNFNLIQTINAKSTCRRLSVLFYYTCERVVFLLISL